MKRVARFFAGPVMVAAGINHFVNPGFYLKIVPHPSPLTRHSSSGRAWRRSWALLGRCIHERGDPLGGS